MKNIKIKALLFGLFSVLFITQSFGQLNYNARRISADTIRARSTSQGGNNQLNLPYEYDRNLNAPFITVNDTLLHDWVNANSGTPAGGGGSTLYEYNFIYADTIAPAAVGITKYNSTIDSLVTEIFVSNTTKNGFNIANILDNFTAGDEIAIGSNLDAQLGSIYDIVSFASTGTLETDYATFTVTYFDRGTSGALTSSQDAILYLIDQSGPIIAGEAITVTGAAQNIVNLGGTFTTPISVSGTASLDLEGSTLNLGSSTGAINLTPATDLYSFPSGQMFLSSSGSASFGSSSGVTINGTGVNNTTVNNGGSGNLVLDNTGTGNLQINSTVGALNISSTAAANGVSISNSGGGDIVANNSNGNIILSGSAGMQLNTTVGGITRTSAAGLIDTNNGGVMRFNNNGTTLEINNNGTAGLGINNNSPAITTFNNTNGFYLYNNAGSITIEDDDTGEINLINNDGGINLDATLGVEINNAYSLPNVDGATGEYLGTNGAGAVTFSSPPNISTNISGGVPRIHIDTVNIGIWDMTATQTLTVSLSGSLSGTSQILISVTTFIYPDYAVTPTGQIKLDPMNQTPINGSAAGGYTGSASTFTTQQVQLQRVAGAQFDSTQFNDATINRGFVCVTYIVL